MVEHERLAAHRSRHTPWCGELTSFRRPKSQARSRHTPWCGAPTSFHVPKSQKHRSRHTPWCGGPTSYRKPKSQSPVPEVKRDVDRNRWINAPEVHAHFVTTTVRGWAPILKRSEIKEALTASLVDDFRFYGAKLCAFVVMNHHLHFVSIRPPDKTISWLLQRIKSNSVKRILPLLTPGEIDLLRDAPVSHGRLLWMRGFRGVPLTTEEVSARKVRYIHRNPVRAKLCESQDHYRWSSYWWIEGGAFTWEGGLDLEKLAAEYGPPPPLQSLKGWRKSLDDLGFLDDLASSDGDGW